MIQRGICLCAGRYTEFAKKNADAQFNFKTPIYLTKIDELSKKKFNGFAADSFTYSNPFTGENELIIAFRGSDQLFMDYLFQNFGVYQVQNKSAREYIKYAVKYRDKNRSKFGPKVVVVVVGNSLGGALAAHVTNHKDTAADVTEAWAFNPSPRTGVLPPLGGNPKIRLLSTKSEVLNFSERKRIGAQKQNEYTDYDLIKSSSIYNHYRWVLAREILWYADFALYLESDKRVVTTPPLEIIKSQQITLAKCERTNLITENRRKDYEINNQRDEKIGRVKLNEVSEVSEVDKMLDEGYIPK
nr:Mbeg1-like protein [Erwinia rhapontici]